MSDGPYILCEGRAAVVQHRERIAPGVYEKAPKNSPRLKCPECGRRLIACRHLIDDDLVIFAIPVHKPKGWWKKKKEKPKVKSAATRRKRKKPVGHVSIIQRARRK